MLARFSKYDFWNLWKILDRHRKNPDQKKNHWKKTFWKNKFKIFGNFRVFPNILRFCKGFLIRKPLQNLKMLGKTRKFPKILNLFFQNVFFQWFFFWSGFFLCRSKIFQRFQKSYLENRASILKVPKIKIARLGLLNYRNLVTFYVSLPLTVAPSVAVTKKMRCSDFL